MKSKAPALTVENIRDFNKTIKTTQEYIKKIIEPNKDKIKVLLLGNTGSGKSSLSCCLSNHKLLVSKNEDEFIELIGKNVGSGFESYTREPIISSDTDINAIYCDCPGFEDTEGFGQEIVNAFAMDKLLEKHSNEDNLIKILLIISYQEFSGDRGASMVRSFIRLEDMFPNFEENMNGIGFVITKGKESIKSKNYISRLSKKPPQQIIRWVNFFNENPENVFVFPEPSNEKIGKQYDFEDHENLLDFLSDNFIINPEHKVALSEVARLQMEQIRMIHLQGVFSQVQCLCDKINKQFSADLSLDEITKWIDIMHMLMDQKVKTSKEFASVIKKIIPNGDQYKKDFEKLEEFELFDSFIDETIHPIEQTSCLADVITAWCHKNVVELLREQKIAFKTESQQKEMENMKKLSEENLRKVNEINQIIIQKDIDFQRRLDEEKERIRLQYQADVDAITKKITQAEIKKNATDDTSQKELYESIINDYKQRFERLEVEQNKVIDEQKNALQKQAERINYLEEQLDKSFWGKVFDKTKKVVKAGCKLVKNTWNKIFH